MNPKRLHHHWQTSLETRVDAIRKLLHKRRHLSATEVHDLRVALRRARLLAGLGPHAMGKAKAKSFRNSTHALLDLLDPIRDCDVALDWLAEVKSSPSLVAKLQIRRARLWPAIKRRLRLPKAKFAIDSKSKQHAKKLKRRLEKQMAAAVRRCQRIIKSDGEISATELHALRRVVRRWRYLRELQLTAHAVRRDPRLRLLVQVQNGLGALQNTEAILEQLKPLGNTQELEDFRSKLNASYHHYRRDALHQIKSLPATA